MLSPPPPPTNTHHREVTAQYFGKWRGVPNKKDGGRVPSVRHSFVSLLQATLSITVLAFLDMGLHVTEEDFMFLVGSFGATAVLLYSAHKSPLAQPRNVMLGHFVSSIAGVTVYKVMGNVPYLSAGFAVGLAIFFMERTNSVHPPGGATALVAIVGGDVVHQAGYWYVIFPCCTGALLMLLIALVCNNLDPERTYPQYWSDYFPVYENFRNVCPAGGASPASPRSSGSASPRPTLSEVPAFELVDEGGGESRNVSPTHATAGTGHVVEPAVLEEEDIASPV